MRIKEGVRFVLWRDAPPKDWHGAKVHAVVQPQTLHAMNVAEALAKEDGLEITITSLLDGEHKENSLHYVGLAFDMRRWHLADPQDFCKRLRAVLGPDYDVVLERTHIHIEFDPD